MTTGSIIPLGRGEPAQPGRAPAPEPSGYSFDASLVMMSDPAGAPAEGIRALRTHLVAQHIHEGRRALAVCGASSGVGCTFVATNLAVAFAQIGLKTLLIDGDLRASSISRIVRPPKARAGLRQSLSSGHRDFREFIEPEVVSDLSILYSGGAAADGQELLAGDRFRVLLDYCLRDFDITVLDTPAANSCSDARLISAAAGYSLIVARRNRSLVADVKTLINQLQVDHAHVVGTVLNEA